MTPLTREPLSLCSLFLLWAFLFTSFLLSNVPKLAEQIAYEGFTPAKIAFSMLTRQGTVLDNRNEDILFCIMLFHERGSNIDKMIGSSGKISTKGKDKVALMKNKYLIKSRAATAGTTGITLPRIALTFAVQSVYYCKHHRVNDPINNSEIPGAYKTQAFASLIPQTTNLIPESVRDSMKAVHLLAMTELTKRINKDCVNAEDTARSYMELGIRNGILSDEQRIEALQNIGVLNYDNVAVDIMSADSTVSQK